jgi:hypothetical protein
VNAYGTVLVLGLLGRAGVGEVPDELTKSSILIAAAVMYAIEFVTDKVPYLDNTWDSFHTVIRPAIGSAIGVEFADLDRVTHSEVIAVGGGSGAIALASHGVKAGLRLGINASPEPFSNIVVSIGEDLAVAGIVALALEHPVPAAAIELTLLAIGITIVVLIWSRIRRAYRGWQAWRERRRADRASREPP